MPHAFPLCIALALLVSSTASSQAAESSQLDRLRGHVQTLAADDMDGRLTGTDGERKAGDYIAAQLQAIGAKPLPDAESFRAPFEFVAGAKDAGTTLDALIGDKGTTTTTAWNESTLVQALSFSENGAAEGSVVFAGYGLRTPFSSQFPFDSFQGLNLKGKIVILLRYFPEKSEGDLRNELARYSGLRFKAKHARDLGAAAVIIVSGPNSPRPGEVIPMTFDTAISGSGIIAASVSSRVMEKILQPSGKLLSDVQNQLDTANPHIGGFEIPNLRLKLNVKIAHEKKTGNNLLAYLPANAPNAKTDEFIMLGGHYDHLGHGQGANSLARENEQGQIHHGADDNASGVAAVLEIGRRLAGEQRLRPVVLCFWSGEELGLLGSASLIKQGAFAAKNVAAYFNFDMVGRSHDNKLAMVSVGSSGAWPRLIEQANVPAGFDLSMKSDPYTPSDSLSFYQAGIPTLDFFSDVHEDYHRPTDTADKINYADMDRVVTFAGNIIRRTIAADARPEYVKVEPTRQAGGDRDTLRAFTGTIPDYTTEVEGLKLSGVIAGGPAEKAGLKGNDVIIEFGGQSIKNIYDYTYALDAVKIGESVKVKIKRGAETLDLTLTPTMRN